MGIGWGCRGVKLLRSLSLHGRIVPPIAVVAEIPGIMIAAEEFRLQLMLSMRVFRWKTFSRPTRFFGNRYALSAGPRGFKPLPKPLPLVGGSRDVKVRSTVVSFLQSLLSLNFQE
ncbi:hypothetical protein DP091_30780 [Paenibacillus sp. MDMC362]|nr:hypothetical protein DP091_30780 [Paenibacillus sp. MDMC362]